MYLQRHRLLTRLIDPNNLSGNEPRQLNRSAASMKHELGLSTLVMLVVAAMIGIGVFLSSGYALASLGNPGRVIVAWVLCGFWALAGAIAYGALARRVPLSGGEYLYLSRLFHPSIGFLAGWISLVAGFTSPIAAMAKAAVKYALPMVTDSGLANVAASVIILLACACHAARVGIGTLAQNGIVIAKLLFIAGLFVWAFGFTDSSAWHGNVLPDRDPAWMPSKVSDWVALLAAMSWISLSYTGFNAAVYVAGESREAKQNVPRAMIGATLLVTIIYVLLNIIFVYAPRSSAVLEDPEAIATLSTRGLGGTAMEMCTRLIVSLAVLSSVFGMLLAGPRVYMQMARDGVMPRFLDAQNGVPRSAVLMQAILSIAVVWAARLEQIIGYLGMTLSACSALTVAAIWRLKTVSLTDENVDGKPISLLESLAAAFYIIGTVAMLMAVVIEGQRAAELWAVGATVLIGFVIYFVWHWLQAAAKDGQV